MQCARLPHMEADLEAIVERITDETSFLGFIHTLAMDRAAEVSEEAVNPSPPYGPGARGWENTTIESFLAAAVEGTIAQRKAAVRELATNPWQRCAEILLTGKYYE